MSDDLKGLAAHTMAKALLERGVDIGDLSIAQMEADSQPVERVRSREFDRPPETQQLEGGIEYLVVNWDHRHRPMPTVVVEHPDTGDRVRVFAWRVEEV